MGGATSRRDDHFDAARFRLIDIFGCLDRRAVRGKHPAFVRNFEFRKHLVGLPHSFPVRLAAHDYNDQRIRRH